MNLTRDQADVLAAYGWSAADILLKPEEGISYARGAQYGRYGGRAGAWNWTTTARGIVAWRVPAWTADEPLITWAQLRAAARALPEKQRADLAWARRRSQRELQRTVAPYLPGGYAPFVRPDPQWQRDADAAQQRALVAALDSLVDDELALFEVA